MREDVKKEWVEALRSGEYTQERGRLATPEGYCCLGVLCELAIKGGAPVTKAKHPDAQVFTYNNATGSLPRAVIDWAGLAAHNPLTQERLVLLPDPDPDPSSGGRTPLSVLNDDMKYTFEQIADVIERDL